MIEKSFKAIEKEIDRKKLKNIYDYAENKGKKASYLYKQDIKPDIDIWIRIEIDYKVFIGYCIAVNGKWENQILSESEIIQFIDGIEADINGWWAY